jgi:hypothetical protein
MSNAADHGLYSTPPADAAQESQKFKILWTLEKWNKSEDHLAGMLPDETVYAPKNLLVTGGINMMLSLLTSIGNFTPYGSGTAQLRVGNGSTAAASGDTDLSGGSLDVSAMDAGFPTVSVTTATWRATYGSSQANFVWNEVAVQNQSGSVGSFTRILNHKVQNFGTKASGSTWTLTLTVTIS